MAGEVAAAAASLKAGGGHHKLASGAPPALPKGCLQFGLIIWLFFHPGQKLCSWASLDDTSVDSDLITPLFCGVPSRCQHTSVVPSLHAALFLCVLVPCTQALDDVDLRLPNDHVLLHPPPSK